MSLNELRDTATRIATQHGFKDATVGEDIALMHSELSEALEDFRHGNAPNAVWYDDFDGHHPDMFRELDGELDLHNPRKPCGIPSEIADVIIRALHFCGKHNIDIEKAVNEKMVYNDTRPYRNGGKKL